MSTGRGLLGRLFVSFLLPSFAVLALVVLVVRANANRALEEAVFDQLEGAASAKEAALKSWADEYYRDILFLSGIPELAERTAQLTTAPLSETSRDGLRKALTIFLQSVAGADRSVNEIFLLAPTGGQVVVSSIQEHVGEYRIYEHYYNEGKKGVFVQNVYPSPLTLQPVMTVSAPMITADGTLAAVLVIHLSMGYLDQAILQQTGLGQSGRVTLVDKNKVFLSGENYGELTSAGATSRAIEEVVDARTGAGIYPDVDGVSVLGVFRWIDEMEIGLIVELEEEEALDPARRLALSVLGIGLACLVLLVAAIYLVAQRIARPILAINEAAAKVSAGDLQVVAPVLTHDEIGSLATTFNRMVRQISTLYDEMERKIEALEQTEEALNSTVAELESKNEELERFNYTVSHDLKSPLVTIKGFLNFIDDDLAEGNLEQARRDLQHVGSAAVKMQHLLHDLLELSRAGQPNREPAPVALAEVVAEAVGHVVGRAHAQQVDIDVEGELPVVFGDKYRLCEVFENLVSNAVKYMGDQPSPKITIGIRRQGGDTGDEEVIFVRDNGRGIEPDEQGKIFELFQRLDGAGEVEGTGVGLAIVQRIVDVHGGRIWVESEGGGRGSTFCLTLPRPPATT